MFCCSRVLGYTLISVPWYLAIYSLSPGLCWLLLVLVFSCPPVCFFWDSFANSSKFLCFLAFPLSPTILKVLSGSCDFLCFSLISIHFGWLFQPKTLLRRKKRLSDVSVQMFCGNPFPLLKFLLFTRLCPKPVSCKEAVGQRKLPSNKLQSTLVARRVFTSQETWEPNLEPFNRTVENREPGKAPLEQRPPWQKWGKTISKKIEISLKFNDFWAGNPRDFSGFFRRSICTYRELRRLKSDQFHIFHDFRFRKDLQKIQRKSLSKAITQNLNLSSVA